MFLSLDFVYVPTADVDAAAAGYEVVRPGAADSFTDRLDEPDGGAEPGEAKL